RSGRCSPTPGSRSSASPPRRRRSTRSCPPAGTSGGSPRRTRSTRSSHAAFRACSATSSSSSRGPRAARSERPMPETVRAPEVVLGSRLKAGSALQQGMPWWKYLANRFLTTLENRVFGLRLSEYHTGYRAFRREVLETVNFGANSDGFVFDQEIVAQVVGAGFRIGEIPVPTRYFKEASQASFLASTVYGLRILAVCFWYSLH